MIFRDNRLYFSSLPDGVYVRKMMAWMLREIERRNFRFPDSVVVMPVWVLTDHGPLCMN